METSENTFGKTGLTPSDSWFIYDSSKIQGFMKCPRHFFFTHVLGWRSQTPNVHLVYGSAFHEAMEHFYNHGMDDMNILRATAKFQAMYVEKMGPWIGDISAPGKDLMAGFNAIEEYAKLYRRMDKFDTLYTEVAGAVPVSLDDLIYVKMDSVIREHKDGGVWSHEHKTTGRLTKAWQEQWRGKIQVGAYNHALKMFWPDDARGVKINGIVTTKDPQFIRIPCELGGDQMSMWLWRVNYYIADIKRNFEALADTSPDDHVMEAFPANTEACSTYGCPFAGLCDTWANPLRNAYQPPLGHVTEFWDPRKRAEEAKTQIVVEDGELILKTKDAS